MAARRRNPREDTLAIIRVLFVPRSAAAWRLRGRFTALTEWNRVGLRGRQRSWDLRRPSGTRPA